MAFLGFLVIFGCAAAADAGLTLIQVKAHQGQAAAVHSAWAAGPFGDCKLGCAGEKATQQREVHCKSIFTGEELPPEKCAQQRPLSTRPCSCDLLACNGCHEGRPIEQVFDSESHKRFEEVGCFPRSEGDVQDARPPRDPSCLSWTGPGLCRSGLPFYRMHSDLMTPSECFNFCMDQGLDLFGLVETNSTSLECRCGATPLNSQVWRNKPPKLGLCMTDFSQAAPIDDPCCPVRLFRYSGHFESGGTPSSLHPAFTVQDLSYVDSIVAGRHISDIEDAMANDTAIEEVKIQLALLEESQVPMWMRNCWPDTCGPAAYLWHERQQQPPAGVHDHWDEYVTIRYWWGSGIDEGRKEAFREAADRWREQTCINLIETPNPSWPWLRVEATDLDSCHVIAIGRNYPGAESLNYPSQMNLGWCRDMRHLGSMIHEIGHVVGMNHEQKRADSTKAYFGKGPHLQIYWQNMAGGTWTQFAEEVESYIGSADDGPGDAYSGYAPYDFESLMHYPQYNNWFDTIPRSAAALVGNRQDLSEGDLLNALDMYQCKRKSAFGSTTAESTTTATPTPATSTIATTTATTSATTVVPSTSTSGRTSTTTTTTTTPIITTIRPELSCRATSLSLQFGGTDESCSAACDVLPADKWPCFGLCDCIAGTTRPSTSTTASVISTTKVQVRKTCVPTEGLPSNGATTSNCQRCADGYQWWPCNTNPTICTCSDR